jgi:hypothetical protein
VPDVEVTAKAPKASTGGNNGASASASTPTPAPKPKPPKPRPSLSAASPMNGTPQRAPAAQNVVYANSPFAERRKQLQVCRVPQPPTPPPSLHLQGHHLPQVISVPCSSFPTLSFSLCGVDLC